jgi:DNA-3-methyladenine glycosylase II
MASANSGSSAASKRAGSPEAAAGSPKAAFKKVGTAKDSPKRRRPARLRGAALQKAMTHLSGADATLGGLIAEYGTLPPERDGRPAHDDHYGALLRSITNQQLSVAAARTIYGRMLERFGGRPPTPEQILADDPEELRLAVGISRPKAGYLRSLAEHVLAGELELDRLDELPDEQVISELVAVKGLGEWTAHMFLMFQLERPDVLAVGDLGVRRAIERAYSLEALPDRETMGRLAEPWRPHRTLACRYLWRSLENEPT